VSGGVLDDTHMRVMACPNSACRLLGRCLGGLPCSHLPEFSRRPSGVTGAMQELVEHGHGVIPHRPPVEEYTRCSVQTATHCAEPAVEWREGDVFDDVVSLLEGLARFRIASNQGKDPRTVAKAIAGAIAALWPDRAYYVELWEEGRAGYAQVVQQYPMPEAKR